MCISMRVNSSTINDSCKSICLGARQETHEFRLQERCVWEDYFAHKPDAWAKGLRNSLHVWKTYPSSLKLFFQRLFPKYILNKVVKIVAFLRRWGTGSSIFPLNLHAVMCSFLNCSAFFYLFRSHWMAFSFLHKAFTSLMQVNTIYFNSKWSGRQNSLSVLHKDGQQWLSLSEKNFVV